MKHFRQLAFVVFFVILFNQVYYSQVFEWAKGFGGMGKSVVNDFNGNSYVTGYFHSTATFDTITLSNSSTDLDIFLAKYDSEGNCIWAKKAGGIYRDASEGVAVDELGNIYIIGQFEGEATFGTQTINSSFRQGEIFLAKYDNNGNCLWVKSMGGINNDEGLGVAVDSEGFCYITGYYKGTDASFGNILLSGSSGINAFIAKYDSEGNCIWAKDGYNAVSYKITTDSYGNSYIIGYFQFTATFGAYNLQNLGNNGDIFLAKYDNNGNCLWVKSMGGINNDEGLGVAVDSEGFCYITGYYTGTATFGTNVLTGTNGYDVFIAKYDSEGNCIWAKDATNTVDLRGSGIGVDSNGNSYVIGYFYGTATFGTNVLTGTNGYDVFIAKYDSGGNCIWAKKAGGTGSDEGHGISVDCYGNINITGIIRWDATFGNINIIGSGFNTRISLPMLNVVTPIGNEIWHTNTVNSITWNSVDDGNIKIEITTDNGTFWTTVENSVPADLGTYEYIVPSFPNSDQCKIRLTSLAYGNVSISNAFTIVIEQPVDPILVSPSNYATGLLNPLMVVWNRSERGEKYILQVSESNNFTSYVINDSTLTDTTKILPELNNYTIYYWRVKAVNVGGESNWSSVSNFKTLGNPYVISTVYPVDNAVNLPNEITFKWRKAVSQEAEMKYWFELSTDSASTAFVKDTTLTDTLKTLTLEYNKKYYWKVKAKNQVGWGNFSAWINFTTQFKPITTPTNLVATPTKVGEVKLMWQDNSDNELGFAILRKLGDSTSVNQLVVIDSVGAGVNTYLDLTVLDTTKYSYKVVAFNADTLSKQSYYATVFTLTGITELFENGIPDDYVIEQNYPNPFNPTTKIKYALPEQCNVTIIIYNQLGEKVIVLVNEFQHAGRYELSFDGGNLSSGVYFYKLTAGKFTETKKMVLVR